MSADESLPGHMRLSRAVALFASLSLLTACAAWRRSVPAPGLPAAEPPTWEFEFLGEAVLPPAATFGGTRVGGLSGITYDPGRDVYYAISDDSRRTGPARFYTLAIDLSDGELDDDDVRFTEVTSLQDLDGTAFEEIVDGEGIAVAGDGVLYVSSEGHAESLVMPFVRRFSTSGESLGELTLPAASLPRESRQAGVRHNLAFESLTVSGDGESLFTATESAWIQDGEPADLEHGSTVRILRYDLAGERLTAAYAYAVDPVAEPPAEANGFSVNGLADLLVLGDDRLLALERSFSVGAGNNIRLYYANLAGAADVRTLESLADPDLAPEYATKTLALDLATLGVPLDNVEGLTFGPLLGDGARTLLLVSDNNFNDEAQKTQFLAFALRPRR